jgi:hypothetical protein
MTDTQCLRAGLDDLVAENVRVRGILFVVAPLGPTVVNKLPVVLILLRVQNKVAEEARGADVGRMGG